MRPPDGSPQKYSNDDRSTHTIRSGPAGPSRVRSAGRGRPGRWGSARRQDRPADQKGQERDRRRWCGSRELRRRARGWLDRLAGDGRHRRPVRLAGIRQHLDIHIRLRTRRLDLPPRARSLPHRPMDRYEGDPVLLVLRSASVELPARRDRVRRAGTAARRVRSYHRDEPDGRCRSRGRRPFVPPAELSEEDARHLGRIDHAHLHRDRAALRGVLHAG